MTFIQLLRTILLTLLCLGRDCGIMEWNQNNDGLFSVAHEKYCGHNKQTLNDFINQYPKQKGMKIAHLNVRSRRN